MIKTWFFEELSPNYEMAVELDLEYEYCYTPGRYSGPPEYCYPDDVDAELDFPANWENIVVKTYLDNGYTEDDAAIGIAEIKEQFEKLGDKLEEWATEEMQDRADMLADSQYEEYRERKWGK